MKKKDCRLRFENNLKSLTHFSIPIVNHFNNSSINLNINLCLSLSLWMKTQTHTQHINIYHINHHQDISSTTTIHVHSFSFHKQHTQSLKTIISLLNPQNQSLPSFSLIHLIQFNNMIQLITFPHSSSITHHTPSFISLIMSELSQVF